MRAAEGEERGAEAEPEGGRVVKVKAFLNGGGGGGRLG